MLNPIDVSPTRYEHRAAALLSSHSCKFGNYIYSQGIFDNTLCILLNLMQRSFKITENNVTTFLRTMIT